MKYSTSPYGGDFYLESTGLEDFTYNMVKFLELSDTNKKKVLNSMDAVSNLPELCFGPSSQFTPRLYYLGIEALAYSILIDVVWGYGMPFLNTGRRALRVSRSIVITEPDSGYMKPNILCLVDQLALFGKDNVNIYLLDEDWANRGPYVLRYYLSEPEPFEWVVCKRALPHFRILSPLYCLYRANLNLRRALRFHLSPFYPDRNIKLILEMIRRMGVYNYRRKYTNIRVKPKMVD